MEGPAAPLWPRCSCGWTVVSASDVPMGMASIGCWCKLLPAASANTDLKTPSAPQSGPADGRRGFYCKGLQQSTSVFMANAYLRGNSLRHRHTGHTRLSFQSASLPAEGWTSDLTGEFSDTWEDFGLRAKVVLVYLS